MSLKDTIANEEYRDLHTGRLFGKRVLQAHRVMVGIPMTGLLRSEWVIARYSGQVIPCNWSHADHIQWIDQWSPLNYLVADARNLIATNFVESDYEWLFFIDHDVILPPATILKFNQRMLDKKVPVWSGLYFAKGVPAEPLLYRGRGNSYFADWYLGDEVWVDGIPMGCTVIHKSIMKVVYDLSEWYNVGPHRVKAIFETPAKTFYDAETGNYFNATGTEDLAWCNRVMDEDVFAKAGWPEYQKKEFPFLVDTSVFCKHIDWDGNQYPMLGEQLAFQKPENADADSADMSSMPGRGSDSSKEETS